MIHYWALERTKGPVIETFIANYGFTVKTFREIKMLTLGTLLGAPCGRKLQRESEANNIDPRELGTCNRDLFSEFEVNSSSPDGRLGASCRDI